MIEAWINGYATKNKNAAFSVMMLSGGDPPKYELSRTYKIGDFTINQSELMGTIFVLEAIKNHNNSVRIFTSNRYVIDMLERNEDKWKKNVINNKELIDQLRDLFLTFMDVQLIFDRDSDKMLEVNLNARGKQ